MSWLTIKLLSLWDTRLKRVNDVMIEMAVVRWTQQTESKGVVLKLVNVLMPCIDHVDVDQS